METINYNHHTKETPWNWEDTKARLSRQEKMFVAEGPQGFNERMFFGRAQDEIKDFEKNAHTWEEVENYVYEKIEAIGKKIQERDFSEHNNLKQEERFWLRFYEQLFNHDYIPRDNRF